MKSYVIALAVLALTASAADAARLVVRGRGNNVVVNPPAVRAPAVKFAAVAAPYHVAPAPLRLVAPAPVKFHYAPALRVAPLATYPAPLGVSGGCYAGSSYAAPAPAQASTAPAEAPQPVIINNVITVPAVK